MNMDIISKLKYYNQQSWENRDSKRISESDNFREAGDNTKADKDIDKDIDKDKDKNIDKDKDKDKDIDIDIDIDKTEVGISRTEDKTISGIINRIAGKTSETTKKSNTLNTSNVLKASNTSYRIPDTIAKKFDIENIIKGHIYNDEEGSCFIIENRYPLSYLYGGCCFGDALNISCHSLKDYALLLSIIAIIAVIINLFIILYSLT